MVKGGHFWLLLAGIILGIVFGAETAFCTRVAVIDFESIGDDPNIGRGVTEIVRTELIKTGNYEVVERALLNKIIEEQRFQLSDLVDPSRAVELGKLLGADLILTGSVVKIGTSYTINARFIDVKTGMAKRAESIRGNEINELTYMSGQLIGILEQEVKPVPVLRPEQPQERPSVPAFPRIKIAAGPRNYLTFSLGGAAFAMEELNTVIDVLNAFAGGDVGAIDGGLNLDFGVGAMVNEILGVGLSSSVLMGVTSGKFLLQDMEHEIKVIGMTFAFRPMVRQKLGDHLALCLGGDLGVIGLKYSDRAESRSEVVEKEGSGAGPFFSGFASGEVPIGNFFLQGNVGFRSAKGEIEFEDSNATIELDFSGPYFLMTAGIRF
ncbi:MAG: hypothetical protein KAJ05_11430 [Candidatus Latescibacteria bacterium]|nr:hypothetical protein [Candidatus Latescibacterota bacterium]